MLKIKVIFYSLIFILANLAIMAKTIIEKPLTWDQLPLSKKVKNSLYDSPYAKSKIETTDQKIKNKIIKEQSIDYTIIGLHKKSCRRALFKLSQYENFDQFIDFVTKSRYDKKNKRINLELAHTLLPFNMTLDFVLERIEKPGVYNFSFDNGFLRGLKGKINVSEYRNRCLFSSFAKWKGPYSRIPDGIFSLFSKILGLKAMERLFQVSETM